MQLLTSLNWSLLNVAIATLVSSVVTGQTSLTGSACNPAANQLRIAFAISQFSTAKLLILQMELLLTMQMLLYVTDKDTTITISGSGAVVKVFKSTGLVRTYNAGPAQVNDWWQIFCLDANKNLIDVGQSGCAVSDFFNRPSN